MNDREQWDSRFAPDGYVFGEAPNAFLVEQSARLTPGMRVLAVADGEGRNGVWMAERGCEVVSVDLSPRGREKALALARRKGVTLDYQIADLAEWDWPEAAFDAVVAIFIQFADPVRRARIFAGMKRAVKPGGVVLIQGYRPEQIAYGTGGPKAVENLYDEALLRTMFGDFAIEHLRIHDSEIVEGEGHRGMSALIDLVARRPD